MCIPKPTKPAPQASTLPTTQAADDLQLVTDELASGASGRLALSTRPRSAKPATAAAATAGAALTGGVPAGADGGGSSSGDTASSAGDVLTGRGRTAGSQQPFYVNTV